jgi:hypothetical protein
MIEGVCEIMARWFPILLVIAALCSSGVFGRTWYVKPDASGDAPSINAGLDSAYYGDTVLVAPGVYPVTEDPATHVEPGPGICLVSDEGPEATTIEVCEHHVGIDLRECEGASVSGFTVRYSDEPGCVTPSMWLPIGISLWNCLDVVVENCNVQGPVTHGIWVSGTRAAPGMPIVRSNAISGCVFGLACGEEMSGGLTPLFHDNVVTECSYGIEVCDSAPQIEGNLFTYCPWLGMHFIGDCGGDCTGNIIAYNGRVGGEWDCGGVGIIDDTEGQVVSFNRSGPPELANDFYHNLGRDIHTGGLGEYTCVEAGYNYWGTDCPDFSRKLADNVCYGCWVDSTHTTVFCDWSHCPEPREASTWGAIKAIYR